MSKHTKTIPYRISEERHRLLRIRLAEQGLSFQQVMEEAVDEWLSRPPKRSSLSSVLRWEGLLADVDLEKLREQDRQQELSREMRLNA